MVFFLGQKIDMIFRKQNQVSAAVAIQITGTERIWGKLAIFNRPTFGRAPAVGALVVLNDQLLGFAVVSDVRTAVAVQVSDHQRGNALLRRDGINAEPASAGNSFISRLPTVLAFAVKFVFPVWL